MSKLDTLDKILIIIFIIAVTMAIITSCQTPKDPLEKAEFDCECIYKSEYDHAIKFKCQDGEYHFIDQKYNWKSQEGDIINEPLNK